MQGPTKIDYSKLLGFDMVVDELGKGVDFNNPTLGARLGAKIGKTTTKELMIMVVPEVPSAGAAIMRGLGGRKVSST